MSTPLRRTGSSWPRWGLLLAVCVGVLSAFDAVLIHVRTGYFSGGFQSPYVTGAADVLTYFLSAAVLDAALVLGIWTAGRFAMRRCTGPLQATWVALLVGLGPPLLTGAVYHGIHATLGSMIETSLLAGGSAGSASTAAMLSDEAPLLGTAAGIAVAICVATVLAAGWWDRRNGRTPGTPLRFGAAGGGFLACTLLGGWILFFAAAIDPLLGYGMHQKTSGVALTSFVQWVTDLDRDGYGVLSTPPDRAPLDGAIHPYAPEIPANGTDENGVGGDRPAELPWPVAGVTAPPDAVAEGRSGSRPSLLLIFLESFRTDLLDAEVDGRPVTPFLARLAREGVSSNQAFVHSPWTLSSRSHLFAGKLFPRAGETTLVDDFKARGYAVALFSGQDDSYGDSVDLMGAERADRFYDARQDLARRTSRTTASVSLQVSWKAVLGRVGDYLRGPHDDRPLFLYVNLVDTHYPYTHAEIDDLLGVGPLPRRAIRPHNADAVFRAYANTAANVDLAVERLVALWHERFPAETSAILVTADHGQSFYEEGTLGHGQRLARAEAQIPLILHGIGGTWREPIAISDLRGSIARNLFLPRGGGVPRARLVGDPDRRVFQHLGDLAEPQRIAFRSLDGLLLYDFPAGAAWRTDSADDRRRGEPIGSPETERLLWTWEALQEREIREQAIREQATR